MPFSKQATPSSPSKTKDCDQKMLNIKLKKRANSIVEDNSFLKPSRCFGIKSIVGFARPPEIKVTKFRNFTMIVYSILSFIGLLPEQDLDLVRTVWTQTMWASSGRRAFYPLHIKRFPFFWLDRDHRNFFAGKIKDPNFLVNFSTRPHFPNGEFHIEDSHFRARRHACNFKIFLYNKHSSKGLSKVKYKCEPSLFL